MGSPTPELVLSIFLSALHVGVCALCVLSILRSRKRAAATILWSLLVLQLPWLGALLYVVFGINRVRRRIERRQEKQALLAPKIRLLPDGSSGERAEARHEVFAGGCPPVFAEFFELLDNITGVGAVPGNRCTLMRGGEQVFPEIERAVGEAERSVNLMTYIFDYDEIGRSLMDRLEERASKGVEVRVLVDGYGSTMFPLRILRRHRQRGMDVRMLRQFQPLRGRASVNLRNHRKLLVCDGRVAFTGGMNVSARHLLGGARRRPQIDYHTKIEGPAALQLQRVFAEDWFDATSESILGPRCFPDVEPAGSDVVRTINSGPDKDEQVMLSVFCAAIQTAGRSIRIVTPYFVPDPAIIMLLKLAALGGIETAVVVPGTSNHPWVKLASRYRYPELLKVGVRIYERESPFSHSKLLLIDDAWASVGSANWDMRTFHLQFDTNVGVVSPDFAAQVRAAIDAEVAASTEIDLAVFLPRPRVQGIAERAMNLFEDLM
jgi:cardiolipin synthase